LGTVASILISTVIIFLALVLFKVFLSQILFPEQKRGFVY